MGNQTLAPTVAQENDLEHVNTEEYSMRKTLHLVNVILLAQASTAMAGHVHSMSDVTGLDTALASKADQTALDVTNVTLAAKADADHEHLYGNMAVVAIDGGEYTDPVSAVAAIASWCGTPSVGNSCLIRLMPGVYDLGGARLELFSKERDRQDSRAWHL